MVKKRVDPRVKSLIEYNVQKNHRSLFVLVGDHGKDQVENLHKILSKTRVKARPSVLWCYKKELGFSTHRKKRIKEIKRNQSRGLHDPDRDDPFDLFISSTNIRWTYYKETDKILGQTFGMCVLQDFEALTPNLLARTIETVEGGGMVIILLKTVKSLKQLYTLSMDVHSRFRTEAHHEIIPRFNERFILSLGDCMSCMVLDDELNILPISSKIDDYLPVAITEDEDDNTGDINNNKNKKRSSNSLYDNDGNDRYNNTNITEDSPELIELKQSLADTPNIGSLVALAKTIDQANVVMAFLDAVSEKTYKSTVALTAARGRGKSAAIGLCLAGAVSYGLSNIFVTAPSPENLKTVFEFVISGLKALKYTEHLDFEVLYEHQGDQGKVVVRINITRSHRQTIQYILPSDHIKLAQAELVAIDEAAAIPLPVVKNLMGPYIVFLSSTVNGYEGTGRALSLKLIQQLRSQQGAAMAAAAKYAGNSVVGAKAKKGERQVHEERWKVAAEAAASYNSSGGGSSGGGNLNMRTLTELTLETPIRYSVNDPIEKWLNNLLCLDMASNSTRLVHVMPAPKDCELYMVNRDALFSYHSLSESLLQKIWALYTAAHYKNTPNDLQMLSDAPAHRLFVLLGPQNNNQTQSSSSSATAAQKVPALPDILCVIQVAFEGFISRASIQSELLKGNKASGDMIPWTISQQFNDSEFATLSGARIVRIATHPDVQKMGYGSRAIDLLISYFQGELTLGSATGQSPPVGTFGGEGVGGNYNSASDRHANNKDTGINSVSNMAEIADITSSSSSAQLINEAIVPRKKTPSLLLPVSERPPECLHWLGVSFGLTSQLLNFWTRKSFKTCYVRQTTNDLTGEHSSILLRELNCDGILDAPQSGWVDAYVTDYRKRLVSLMSYSFCQLETALAITLVDPDRKLTSSSANTITGSTTTATGNNDDDNDDTTNTSNNNNKNGHKSVTNNVNTVVNETNLYGGETLSSQELLTVHLSHHDLKRLELYSRNMVDHHMILDCVPILARLTFLSRIPNIRLSFLQVAILLATGLQHRDVDSIAKELDIPVSQVLAFFNKTIRKITTQLKEIVEAHVSKELLAPKTLLSLEQKAKNMGRNNTSTSTNTNANANNSGNNTTGTNSKKNCSNNNNNNGEEEEVMLSLLEEQKRDTKEFMKKQRQQAASGNDNNDYNEDGNVEDELKVNAQVVKKNKDKDKNNSKSNNKNTTTDASTILTSQEFKSHTVKATDDDFTHALKKSTGNNNSNVGSGQKVVIPKTISIAVTKTADDEEEENEGVKESFKRSTSGYGHNNNNSNRGNKDSYDNSAHKKKKMKHTKQ